MGIQVFRTAGFSNDSMQPCGLRGLWSLEPGTVLTHGHIILNISAFVGGLDYPVCFLA